MLLNAALGLVAAITARISIRFRVSRYVYYVYNPSLVLIALTVTYTGLFSIFLIPGWDHETNRENHRCRTRLPSTSMR